jgi:hypothetical protein
MVYWNTRNEDIDSLDACTWNPTALQALMVVLKEGKV